MIDFFAKAMGEIKETKLSEIPEMPKFFEDLPESQEDKDSPVATIEMNEYSEEDLQSSPLSGTETSIFAESREGISPPNEIHGEDNSEQKHDDGSEASEVKTPIQNKIDGLAREKEVAEELQEKYPPEEGYEIVSEAYLRDKDGNIVRDSETGEARRVDFVVVKDGKVVDSVEVTSKTADKTEQTAKEERIREAGGNYIRDYNGNLVEIPSTVQTRIERRD